MKYVHIVLSNSPQQ